MSDRYTVEHETRYAYRVPVSQSWQLAHLTPRHLPWQKVLRHEIGMASNPKPFFNERVQELHGGGRDRRATDDARIAAKQCEAATLERLQRVLSAS